MFVRRIAIGMAAALCCTAALAACSSSGGDSAESASPSASASAAPSTSASPSASENATVEFNKQIQEELNAVGCSSGPVDGMIGPDTDAAIVRFQEASGLPADGELNAATESALKEATDAGETVCTSSASPSRTTTPSPTSTQPVAAPCTAAALSEVLKSNEEIQTYVCADAGDERWAAGKVVKGNDPAEYSFFAKAEDENWVRVPSDEVCGTASAGLPSQILAYCSDGE